jgi:hypothetical protein
MKRSLTIVLTAALLAEAACFFPSSAHAGSCCGGGAATTLILPKFAQGMVDTSVDVEKYDGFWTSDGKYLRDQPGTDLSQYRLNLGVARRLAKRWQASIAVPYLWNDNRYSGISSRSERMGDTMLSLWYEAFDSVMCRWRYFELSDLKPAATFGLSLTIPTGKSPYDNVNSSFDITGRGFYRIDGNVLLDQTIFPWSASLFMSYGTYIERPVDREYGAYVQPYRKKLGDRAVGTLALSYNDFIDFLETRQILIYSAALTEVWEGRGTIDGDRDPTSGLRKTSVAGALAYSTLDRTLVVKLTVNHSIKKDGWGNDTPASDIYSLGVTYAFE